MKEAVLVVSAAVVVVSVSTSPFCESPLAFLRSSTLLLESADVERRRLARERREEKRLASWDAISNAMGETVMSVVALQRNGFNCVKRGAECT
jgi:hypothetical protein